MPVEWIHGLSIGDRVMIRFSEAFVKIATVTGTRGDCVTAAKRKFYKQNGICCNYSGYSLIPYDPDIAKEQRIRNKAVRQLAAAKWDELPTETLKELCRVLEVKPF